MTTTTTRNIVEAGDLVRILRGTAKGTQFIVQSLNDDNTVNDEAGKSHKRGNLVIEQKNAALPNIEPEPTFEEVEVVEPTRNLPRVSRGRRQTETSDDLPACKCGCGLQVLKRNRTFRQGHDQRYRGQMVRQLETSTDEAEVQEAIDELMRHWFDAYTRTELRSRAHGLETPEEQGAVEVTE